MQANRSKDTRAELALRRELHRRGLRYFIHRRPVPGVRRTADLLFPRVRVAVFVDGCFWHGCPIHHTTAKANAEFWADKVAGNQARDRETDRLLAAAGWTVIRVWEHSKPDETAEQISRVVATLRAQVPTARGAADDEFRPHMSL